MYARRIIIACASGGPLESIVDAVRSPNESTGYLCEPNSQSFAGAMKSVLSMSESDRQAMGERGRKRVVDSYSLERMGDELQDVVHSLKRPSIRLAKERNFFIVCIMIVLIISSILISRLF
jgi:alpha-1,3/alpha-1,6-mannosyltransferase